LQELVRDIVPPNPVEVKPVPETVPETLNDRASPSNTGGPAFVTASGELLSTFAWLIRNVNKVPPAVTV
jgi:hypothetical protein